jgi:hypothetical protein
MQLRVDSTLELKHSTTSTHVLDYNQQNNKEEEENARKHHNWNQQRRIVLREREPKLTT